MSRRDVQVVAPGLLRIEQRILAPRREIGTDVSGPACVYARVLVRRGAITYLHGTARIAAPRRYGVFLPPFTIVQASLERCDVVSIAWAFRPPPTGEMLWAHPVLFPSDDDWQPRSAAEALIRMRVVGATGDISRAPDPAPLAATTKAIIDRDYRTSLEIGTVAARCRVSPAVLSRTFKGDYGVPPVRYRHQVRIVDALTRPAGGDVPADVFQDVGFNDLSRFYKIFRKLACAAPGAYRSGRSRNAKT